jgi:hypothetical protein
MVLGVEADRRVDSIAFVQSYSLDRNALLSGHWTILMKIAVWTANNSFVMLPCSILFYIGLGISNLHSQYFLLLAVVHGCM